jgi:four helix bundle protein
MSEFNQKYCHRTKALAVDVIKFFVSLPKNTEYQVIGKQLFRSGTSVAANFRAASRARSNKEYYAKLSLVVEECDETVFWLELLEESNLLTCKETSSLKNEAEELLKIFASTRKKVGANL